MDQDPLCSSEAVTATSLPGVTSATDVTTESAAEQGEEATRGTYSDTEPHTLSPARDMAVGGDVDEELNEDGEEEEDGSYAAEFASLLCRVVEMEAMEEQRARQRGFVLRMTRRGVRRMSEALKQQQMYLDLCAAQLAAVSGSSDHGISNAAESESDTHAEGGSLSSPSPPPAEPEDALLACAAYNMDYINFQYQFVTNVMGILRSHARATSMESAYVQQLRLATEEALARLHEDADLEGWPHAQRAVDGATESSTTGSCGGPSARELRQKEQGQQHAESLSKLGGTLAKVHTLFAHPECCVSMSVTATALTEVGRQCTRLLREVQALTEANFQLEADLKQRRSPSLEWGLFAAHVQQARTMSDLYSPLTTKEMRVMALSKALLRRRQDLQSVLTLAILRDAELRATEREAATPGSSSLSKACTQSSPRFTSPPAAVTPETWKALSDTCARRENLRDRLWRELLYLKKSARRELGSSWLAAVEARALSHITEDMHPIQRQERLTVIVEEDLRRAAYDRLALLLATVLSEEKQRAGRSMPLEAAAVAADVKGTVLPDEKGKVLGGEVAACGGSQENASQEDGDASLAPLYMPSSINASNPTSIAAVRCLLESLETRAHSLASLLLENAKHWQRTTDVVVEAEIGTSSPENAWCHTAAVFVQRCALQGNPSEKADERGRDEEEEESAALTPPHPRLMLSPFLQREKQLMECLAAYQSSVIEWMKTSLSQLYTRCEAPTQQRKREVALLLRLLQLSDEVKTVERDQEDLHDPHISTTFTTPALERAVRLLRVTGATDDDTGKSIGDSLLNSLNASTILSPLRLPLLQVEVDRVQGRLRDVSAQWKCLITADTASIRSSVMSTQAKLSHYARFSMAEVPALLDQARAESVELKRQREQRAAETSHIASLADEMQRQRELLARCTATERPALATAVELAHQEVAALRLRVAALEARKALARDESLNRQELLETEEEAWEALPLPGMQSWRPTSAMVEPIDTAPLAGAALPFTPDDAEQGTEAALEDGSVNTAAFPIMEDLPSSQRSEEGEVAEEEREEETLVRDFDSPEGEGEPEEEAENVGATVENVEDTADFEEVDVTNDAVTSFSEERGDHLGLRADQKNSTNEEEEGLQAEEDFTRQGGLEEQLESGNAAEEGDEAEEASPEPSRGDDDELQEEHEAEAEEIPSATHTREMELREIHHRPTEELGEENYREELAQYPAETQSGLPSVAQGSNEESATPVEGRDEGATQFYESSAAMEEIHNMVGVLGESVLGPAVPAPPQMQQLRQQPVLPTSADLLSGPPPPPVLPDDAMNRPVFDDNPFYAGFGFEEE